MQRIPLQPFLHQPSVLLLNRAQLPGISESAADGRSQKAARANRFSDNGNCAENRLFQLQLLFLFIPPHERNVTKYVPKPADTITNTYDFFLFASQSNMAGRGISCPQFPEAAPALISGAGVEFRAISDPSALFSVCEPFGSAENTPDGIHEPGMKTGSLVTSFVNAYIL